MIGRAEWFERRKFGGWGLSIKTWQGWVYIIVFMAPMIIFQSLPQWDVKTRLIFTGIWIAILLIDVIDIMIHMKKDERESKHEAIAERNSAWAMVGVITAGILYYSFKSSLTLRFEFDWFLAAALFAGVITKGISNYYLDKKD